MENQGRKASSFSFPVIPIQDNQEFEFGCVTPASPASPADHLFMNGKLLPHYFPCQPSNFITNGTSFSRSMSRTSSVCSKDSVFSSRSNSTNSSRSSTSEQSTLFLSSSRKAAAINAKNPVGNKPVLGSIPRYGSSNRWQFIAPAPEFKHQSSVSSSRGGKGKGKCRRRRAAARDEDQLKKSKKGRGRTWFGIKIFLKFVSACKECHAINPSPKRRLDKNQDAINMK